MTIITNYKLPETDEEIRENRVKFVSALINENAADQCRGQLFEYPAERGIGGEAAKEATHRRCALGLAANVFFGITTADELDDWQARDDDDHPYGFDITDEIGKMLDIPYGSDVALCSISGIIEANDDNELSFAQIGTNLKESWELS